MGNNKTRNYIQTDEFDVKTALGKLKTKNKSGYSQTEIKDSYYQNAPQKSISNETFNSNQTVLDLTDKMHSQYVTLNDNFTTRLENLSKEKVDKETFWRIIGWAFGIITTACVLIYILSYSILISDTRTNKEDIEKVKDQVKDLVKLKPNHK